MITSGKAYKRGHVVVVNVPFTGQKGSKPRPAVVVSMDSFHRRLPDVILCPISSQARFYSKPGPGDCPLVHWKKIGLRFPSTARLSNLVAVEKDLIRRVIGTMPSEDLDRIKAGLRLAFGL